MMYDYSSFVDMSVTVISVKTMLISYHLNLPYRNVDGFRDTQEKFFFQKTLTNTYIR